MQRSLHGLQASALHLLREGRSLLHGDGPRDCLPPRAVRSLLLAPDLPPVALLARRVGEPQATLPLVGEALAVPPGQTGVYVSEAMVDLYGLRPGHHFPRIGALMVIGRDRQRHEDCGAADRGQLGNR